MNLICKLFGHKERFIHNIFNNIKKVKCKRCKKLLRYDPLYTIINDEWIQLNIPVNYRAFPIQIDIKDKPATNINLKKNEIYFTNTGVFNEQSK